MVRMKIPERLETERLIIRPFLAEDFELFYKFMSDRNATKYMIFTEENKTYDGAKKLVEDTIKSYNTDKPLFALTIADRNTNQFLGSCGVAPLEKEGEVECYYIILPEYWGRGLATEALKKLIEYTFLELKMSKISAFIFPENKASIAVAKKAGMQFQEKVKRKQYGNEEIMRFQIEKS